MHVCTDKYPSLSIYKSVTVSVNFRIFQLFTQLLEQMFAHSKDCTAPVLLNFSTLANNVYLHHVSIHVRNYRMFATNTDIYEINNFCTKYRIS